MQQTDRRTKPILRIVLLGTTVLLTIAIMQAVSSGVIPEGPIRTFLLVLLVLFGFIAFKTIKNSLKTKAAARRVKELLVVFDDVSMLRPRAQAARALLAGAPSNDIERRSLIATSQWLAEIACAVNEGGQTARSELLRHSVAGAWFRAIAVTPVALSFNSDQQAALKKVYDDVGADTGKSTGLDAGSRALIERDSVMFRSEHVESIF